MSEIPRDLVKSLMELGLLESEAKIYITLSMMNNSEVKRLINFLGLSKPNTYESLRLLEEKGLVVLINTRPMTYQATPPEIGLEILLDTHLDAKKKAEKLFSSLDRKKFTEKPSKLIWYVLGEKSIDYKIKDMIKDARKSIYLTSSPSKYLKHFQNLDNLDLKLDITIYINNESEQKKLKNKFRNKDVNFRVISEIDMIKGFLEFKPIKEDELKTHYKEAIETFDFENLLVFIVDDSELLYVLPFSEGSSAAINTKNKAFLLITRIAMENITAISYDNSKR